VASDSEAQALVFRLQSRGYRTLAAIEQEAAGRLSTVRLLSPGEGIAGVVVDLLFASSGIEHEVVQGAETLEIVPGLAAPVASTGHLARLRAYGRGDLLARRVAARAHPAILSA
jgi:hypothetical protein